VHRTRPLLEVKRTCSTHRTGLLPMTGQLRLVILVAALALLLGIVMVADGHPLAVIAAMLVAIFLTGRLTQ
jgi:hypothetical protein